MTVWPNPVDAMPTSNWFFECQPMALEILTQQSRCKKAESNLLSDEKGLQHWFQVVVWIIHLYLYIFWYFRGSSPTPPSARGCGCPTSSPPTTPTSSRWSQTFRKQWFYGHFGNFLTISFYKSNRMSMCVLSVWKTLIRYCSSLHVASHRSWEDL